MNLESSSAVWIMSVGMETAKSMPADIVINEKIQLIFCSRRKGVFFLVYTKANFGRSSKNWEVKHFQNDRVVIRI